MMIRTSVEYIDPAFAIPASVTLFILWILIVLIQRKRREVRLTKEIRATILANRREAYIRAANDADDKYNEELDSRPPQKRERR